MSRAANSTVVRSPPAGPIAWMPIGSPVAVVVMGMVVAGVPAMLNRPGESGDSLI